VTARIGDVMIDSSGWVQLLRHKGETKVRNHVRQLIVTDRAVWCDVILLELWRGAANDSDRKMLRELQSEIRSLEMSPAVWAASFQFAGKCRPKGIVVPTTDLMIYACAQVHRVELYHLDKHFDLLTAAGIG
jgi:predicted nucleic acid-binding protein